MSYATWDELRKVKLRAYISITRPLNGILMFIAVLVGVLFSENRVITLDKALLAFTTSFGLNASSMVINDYFDREIDKINHPSRPIPAGIITGGEAIVYSILLASLGLMTAILISIPAFLFASFAYVVAVLYNAYLKKTGFIGNMLVSVDVVAPFLYGSIISDGMINTRVLSFALLAFLSNTGREVVKGMVDVVGDEIRSVNTIARVHGLKTAAKTGGVLYLSAVILSPLPYLLEYVTIYYLPLVALADIGFIYSALSIIKNPIPENAKKQKNLTLIWMLIALLSFIVGGLTKAK